MCNKIVYTHEVIEYLKAPHNNIYSGKKKKSNNLFTMYVCVCV